MRKPPLSQANGDALRIRSRCRGPEPQPRQRAALDADERERENECRHPCVRLGQKFRLGEAVDRRDDLATISSSSTTLRHFRTENPNRVSITRSWVVVQFAGKEST